MTDALLTQIGVGLTLMGTLVTVYYSYKASRTTKYIETVTTERIKWMGILRDYLSEYFSLLNICPHYNPKNDYLDKIQYILALSGKIRLHLNPKDKRDQSIINTIGTLSEAYVNCLLPTKDHKSKRTEYRELLKNHYEILVKECQEYLKDEWERVKQEVTYGHTKNKHNIFNL